MSNITYIHTSQFDYAVLGQGKHKPGIAEVGLLNVLFKSEFNPDYPKANINTEVSMNYFDHEGNVKSEKFTLFKTPNNLKELINEISRLTEPHIKRVQEEHSEDKVFLKGFTKEVYVNLLERLIELSKNTKAEQRFRHAVQLATYGAQYD